MPPPRLWGMSTPGTVPYLRVVVTARCTLACAYCHAEGDWSTGAGSAGGLPLPELMDLLRAGIRAGVRKIKLLGGEPLLRADLPDLVRAARTEAANIDISVITAGAVPTERIDALFAAGLSRANLSIHGWSESEFATRTRRPGGYPLRQAMLERLMGHGRFLKLNYVYRGTGDDADLAALLAWAAGRPVTVGLLDDLGRDVGPDALMAALRRARGEWSTSVAEPDPYSLPTRIVTWSDGLRVEVKDHRLGQIAPWKACAACPVRARCGEGIHAVRLTHDGRLRQCLDRPELGVDLRAAARTGGAAAAAATWGRFVEESLA